MDDELDDVLGAVGARLRALRQQRHLPWRGCRRRPASRLYVLGGRLRLVLGERDLVLRRGEAAEFDTRVPHWFGKPAPRRQIAWSSSGGRGSVSTSVRGLVRVPESNNGEFWRRNQSYL